MTEVRENYSDDIRRVKDALDFHAVLGNAGWVSFALADGSTDHVAYDSWGDAVSARKWDRDNFFYIEIQPDGCPTYKEAAGVIAYARMIHSMGHRIPPPDSVDGGFGVLTARPARPFDRARMAHQLRSGKPLYPAEATLSNLPAAYRKEP